ncbi:hypothetical protein [Aneurinibacillus tyrosinisolvens]|uniref:hypothetical protein n=1 Tax=Aneurinibacillus tyrosinisolvens TaxID=1443435 RepID=UPI00063EDC49|nr:hypothetical protein [Aneurinibacillus tyrosinisolvens]
MGGVFQKFEQEMYQKAREEGFREGINLISRVVVLLQNGTETAEIVEKTGLSEEQIEKIKGALFRIV